MITQFSCCDTSIVGSQNNGQLSEVVDGGLNIYSQEIWQSKKHHSFWERR